MGVTVQIIGLKEANRAVRQLPELAKDEAQGVMDVTAYQVWRGAVGRAPTGPTGNLKRSLQWERRARSLSAVVGVDRAAYYWRFVEFGTVRMPAQPFLRPAADAMRDDHHRRLLQALERAATKLETIAK